MQLELLSFLLRLAAQVGFYHRARFFFKKKEHFKETKNTAPFNLAHDKN
jgi:hypothetical protein